MFDGLDQWKLDVGGWNVQKALELSINHFDPLNQVVIYGRSHKSERMKLAFDDKNLSFCVTVNIFLLLHFLHQNCLFFLST